MMQKIELLAPGGDIKSIKAAVAAGADAIYCGLDRFNARNRASNISYDNLLGVLELAHKNGCKIFLTLNIIILDSEIPALFTLLNKLVNTTIDGLIVQDLGLFYLLKNQFPTLKIHASTQLTTHNIGQVNFLEKLSANRINLSRELNINEIKELTQNAHKKNVLTEVFVHGSNCISFSGQCYVSSLHGGNSGNRGRCSQPCRDEYLTTSEGKIFPLNIKDNSAFLNLNELAEAGVDSLKIEGRIKKFHYVYTVVKTWRKQIDNYLNNYYLNNCFLSKKLLNDDKEELYSVFNRDFSNTFLTGEIGKEMFIDNPRDNSAIYLAEKNGGVNNENIEKAKKQIYDSRTKIITSVEDEIKNLSIEKIALKISVWGKEGETLKFSFETPENSFEILSKTLLRLVKYEPKSKKEFDKIVSYKTIYKRFKSINETKFFIENIETENLQENLTLSFKELTTIKKKALFWLNGSQKIIDPVEPPQLKNSSREKINPTLSVLISSKNDISLTKNSSAKFYFELPNSLKDRLPEFIDIFKSNPQLIPWFPSIIIAKDYRLAKIFLTQLKPKEIITNNSGIAFEAFKMKISWTAGPYFNLVNSFSLINLKENFNCAGAFISNEINRKQIGRIRKPDNFKLSYSIFHPIVLMTSRQCLFHQVTGCKKNRVDDTCISNCSKMSTIKSLTNISLTLEKSAGNYHTVYDSLPFLNLDIISEIDHLFNNFLLDFRDKIEPKSQLNKEKLLQHFESFLAGNLAAENGIKEIISLSTKVQYEKGL